MLGPLRKIFNPSPTPKPPTPKPPTPPPDYESILTEVLTEAENGNTWGQLKGLLFCYRTNDKELAQWLEDNGETLDPALRQRLGVLAAVATGKLKELARNLTPLPPSLQDKGENTSEERLQAAESYFYQGVERYKRGDFLEAIASWDHALQFKPDYHLAWYNRGIALYDLGRLEEAIASYDHALQLKPDYHEAWNNRGVTLSNLGRYEEAIASWDYALQLKPDYPQAWYKRGLALKDLGRLEEAIASLDYALQIQPDYYEAWNNRGLALKNLANMEEAIASYDHALQLKPDYPEAWLNRGIAAGKLRSHNSFCQQSFAALFEISVSQASQVILENLDTANPALEPLKTFLRQPLSSTVKYKIHLDSLRHPSRSKPELNLRGYEGELASYRAELDKAICKDTHPLGWGMLHHEIGLAHYFQGKYREAEDSYKTALETLTPDNNDFLERHLEVVQDLVKVLLHLGKKEEAQQRQLDGLEVLKRLYNLHPSAYQREQLDLKFNSFRALRVDILIQLDRKKEALTSAELEKNRHLTHLLEAWDTDIISPTYEEIEALLTPTRAIIYWHLSPYALTTFILKPNHPEPIIIHLPGAVSAFTTWLKEWDKQYEDYRAKKTDNFDEKDDHPWRSLLDPQQEQGLGELKAILNISRILEHLGDSQELILIPHQDLHRLPLHLLLERVDNPWNIAYLPSLQLGKNLQERVKIVPQPLSLLSIENPANDLPFAEIESGIINAMFSHVTPLDSSNANKANIINKLAENHHIFHFTGHGSYNSKSPGESALILTESERLTAYEISHLNLKNYQLVCLAACETALTGTETLEREYVGLVSAFLRGGAGCVISTLWTVKEDSSAWLMIQFYQRFLKGDTPIDALQKSQEWLRNISTSELATWLENLVQNISLKDTLRDSIEAKINAYKCQENRLIYNHPYHWAGYIISRLG